MKDEIFDELQNPFDQSFDEDLVTEGKSVSSWGPREWHEAEQKMYDFEYNGRKENVKACADDKLEAYYKICCQKNYTSSKAKIEAELQRRGLNHIIGKYSPKQTQTTNTPNASNTSNTTANTTNSSTLVGNQIVESDFDTIKVNAIKNAEKTDNADMIVKICLAQNGTQKTALIMLIIAVAAGCKKVSDALVNFLRINCSWTVVELQNNANVVLNNPKLMAHITNLIQGLGESLYEKKEPHLIEKVEKHSTLNQKLFDGTELKDEVKEHILKIVDKFVEELEEDGIRIVIEDIVLIGSNVSYNYTDKSDLDIHIIADTSSLNCPDNLYPLIYSAYRSLFNKKFDIEFYGIPVELFVEAGDVPTVSNGIYSVKNSEWIKEPVAEDIPDIDQKSLDMSIDKWEDEANTLMADIENESIEPQDGVDKIVDYIERIYDLRKRGLTTTGEYGIENLTFKELRNAGLLDKLKDLKNELNARILSLESLHEVLDERKRREYAEQLSRAARTQVILQTNGYFFVHNVKEDDVDMVIRAISKLAFVSYVRKGAAGRFDFSHIHPNAIQKRLFTVEGKVKD